MKLDHTAFWIHEQEVKSRRKFSQDWKEVEEKFYWDDVDIAIDALYGNKNKDKMEKEIKAGDVSLQKLSQSTSHLLEIKGQRFWISYNDLKDLKKVLSKIK